MTTTEPAVIDLDDPAAQRLARVGGKGANLATMRAAGFPVPDGFCVDTDGYRQAAAAAGLPDLLIEPGPTPAARARAALLATPVPPETAAAVRAAYAALGQQVPVAVRSSATAEDLPTASFAGQQDTVLNVVGADAVLDAVRRCWASLWTERAVHYREQAGIPHREVALAVVVQRMVDAELAGVLFTADPLTGQRTRTVIDAAPGLGESVVSGAVNPDHIVVEGDGTVSEYRMGGMGVAIRPLPGGGTERVPRAGTDRVLTTSAIAELVALGRRVEALFGAPQDIEWAIDSTGTPWLTQSRPITTLYPLPARRATGTRVYFCFTLAQGLVRPITPIGRSAFRIIASGAAREVFGASVPDPLIGPDALQELGGRTFVDVTPALRHPIGRIVLPRVLDVMEARAAVVLRALAAQPEFAPRGSRVRFARGALRALIRFRAGPVALLALASPSAGRRYLRRLEEPARRLQVLPAVAGAEQRLAAVQRAIGQVFPAVPRFFPVWAPALGMLALARALAGPDLDATRADDVLRSLPHNVTSQMDRDLWGLADRMRTSTTTAAELRTTPPAELARRYHRGALPAELQRGLAGFLARYGHRAVAEIDLGLPRWSEDPTYVLGVLAGYLRLDEAEHAPDVRFTRGAARAEATVREVVAAVRERSRPRAALVGWMLGRVRALAGEREAHKDHLVRVLAHARQELGLVGAELVGQRLLDSAEDVWMLELGELRDAARGAPIDLRGLATRRRADYDRELRRRHVPRILLSDGTEPEAVRRPGGDAAPGDLIGTPASAGTVTAPARVVLDPEDARLEPGEILVAPSTDPGWTPLFLTAGGLVMEMGGPNSHGAVVAREYGIPAVVGVAGATTRLRTGQPITVDGADGSVRLSVS